MIYRIADLIVQMDPEHDPLKSQAIPYLYEGEYVKIDCIIPKGENAIKRYNDKHPELTVGEAEYLLYGAYFYDTLLMHEGIMLHASCIVYEGQAYLFSANSGTGKSTHTQIWTKIYPGSFILNDDKPAIRYLDGQFFAYGTPFSGKTDLNRNEMYPIASIAFINRSSENSISKLDVKEIIPLFFSQTLSPNKEDKLDMMAKMIENIIVNIPIYELNCNMEEEAAIVAYQGMKRK